jgi:mycothiol synthase
MTLKLPIGFQARAATEADLPELAMLDATHTKHAVGSVLRNENEIRIEWKSPTFDPQTDSQVITTEDGRIVGWCEVYDFAPHTRFQSRLRLDPTLDSESSSSDGAIAKWLIQWSIERARQSLSKALDGERVVLTQGAYQTTPKQITLLEDAGFSYVRSFLRMRIEMMESPIAVTWPNGIVVRSMVAGDDDHAAVAAHRDAFQDHWGHVDTAFEEDLEEWKQWIHEDEDFDTDLWFLAMDGDEIAGFCQCYPIAGDDPKVGLVDGLGVRRQWRGRGIATALLQHAFGVFFERDKPIVELSVDSQSPTGATRLYEKAGMSTTWTNSVYEIELRSAGEPA